MSFEKLKNMTDEEKRKQFRRKVGIPTKASGKKKQKEDTGHEFDPDSEACGTCGGCGGEE